MKEAAFVLVILFLSQTASVNCFCTQYCSYGFNNHNDGVLLLFSMTYSPERRQENYNTKYIIYSYLIDSVFYEHYSDFKLGYTVVDVCNDQSFLTYFLTNTLIYKY